ncbi:MAG: hypothetical protein ACK55I_43530, partial [bacterium]
MTTPAILTQRRCANISFVLREDLSAADGARPETVSGASPARPGKISLPIWQIKEFGESLRPRSRGPPDAGKSQSTAKKRLSEAVFW